MHFVREKPKKVSNTWARPGVGLLRFPQYLLCMASSSSIPKTLVYSAMGIILST